MPANIFMAEVVQPILIKDGGLFLACQADGDIALDCEAGLGLFHRDTRYLARYELRVGGKPCLTLMSSPARGCQSVHELTNVAIKQTRGGQLELQSLGVRLERTLDGESLTLKDRLALRSYVTGSVSFEVEIILDALFEDIFELRGQPPKAKGPLRSVTSDDRSLTFRYAGADAIVRTLTAVFSQAPTFSHRGRARMATFDVTLSNQQSWTLDAAFTVSDASEPPTIVAPDPAFYAMAQVQSDDAKLDRVLARSFADLRLLRTGLHTNFIAGGMPWFVSPFGRDSILAALQGLPFDPRPAEGVARLFALYQGQRNHTETREQPGKIPHELRLGEMAHLKEIPQRPSYTSVDSTPLFLILLTEHAAWAGAAVFQDLRPAVDAALNWLLAEIADGPGGYVCYRGQGEHGPINQGWKDSVTGVPRKDGSAPLSPIALCEVQGYAYRALVSTAEVLRGLGDVPRADQLQSDAGALRERFNRDFWMEDEGCYALALERGGRQVTVVTSNAGQVLWSGIADPDKAMCIAERMLRPDMDSGWGVRTLSSLETSYNPLNYHLGSVWPFDNALIVAGLKRYGLDEAARTVFQSVLDAADCFALGRLPEFYVGHQREPGLFPSRCPFAEPIQAWSSGAIPYMLTALLGLHPDGSSLGLDRPLLPQAVSRLSLGGLTVGGRHLGVEIKRDGAGQAEGVFLINKETAP